eukprot:TRINITY_DN20303_c0_g1_i1.p1 TRINITY_DN20303_c0_g1~~TRINITY_DN20303_c0_g1_i1.p1  ORF type:complete len:775 (-),score=193.50 TRINITY_DN20303_c0_g1_i1:109-2433(-)
MGKKSAARRERNEPQFSNELPEEAVVVDDQRRRGGRLAGRRGRCGSDELEDGTLPGAGDAGTTQRQKPSSPATSPPSGPAAAPFAPRSRGRTAGGGGGGGSSGCGGPGGAAAASAGSLFGIQCHHGKYIRADACGAVRGTSSNIGDPEKFELVRNDDSSVSLRSHHGTYLAAERSGDVRASRSVIGDPERLTLETHPSGKVSFRSFFGAYIAATKGGLIANRGMAGAWELYELKPRGRRKGSGSHDGADEVLGETSLSASAGGLGSNAAAAGSTGRGPILFDACCDLEAVLFAEERYAASHLDRTATVFEKRARVRRAKGLELSFAHFREDQKYPASFRGCIASWDATMILAPGERFDGIAAVGSTAEVDEAHAASVASAGAGANAWETVLEQAAGDGGSSLAGAALDEPGVLVRAAFGIPAASAAEADAGVYARLEALCRLPCCAAVGPVGLDATAPPEDQETHPAADTSEHDDKLRGLCRADLAALFGVPLHAFASASAGGSAAAAACAYDARRDPECLAWLECNPGAKSETWIFAHGDRRQAEFSRARADYARRRAAAEVEVARRQVRLAQELKLPLIVQIPPQDEAERRMADLLIKELGEGSTHPVLLSAFRGRPKCAALLLRAFPRLVVGFSGLLTHRKLERVLGEVAFDIPLDRFVLESLGPLYPPAAAGVGDARGSYSHPVHVSSVAAELARVKGISSASVLEAAWRNASVLFGLAARSDGAASGEAAGEAAASATGDASSATADACRDVAEATAPRAQAIGEAAAV